jgi:hypothetical protein
MAYSLMNVDVFVVDICRIFCSWSSGVCSWGNLEQKSFLQTRAVESESESEGILGGVRVRVRRNL